jgi:hypothetical protein
MKNLRLRSRHGYVVFMDKGDARDAEVLHDAMPGWTGHAD